jgi:hypothetical protein
MIAKRTWTKLQEFAIHKADTVEWQGHERPLDLIWASGRGDGKTTGAEGVAWRWARDYPGIFILFLKHERKSLAPVFKSATEFFASCDQNVTFTKEPMFVRFSNGSTMLFEGLADRVAYEKSLQGMSAGAMIIDELGSFPDLDLPLSAISNIRGDEWPRCVWFLCNPGGRSHGSIYDLFLGDRPQNGDIFETSAGRVTMFLSGTHRDNPFLDADYVNALKSATRNDPTKQAMWLDGSWHLLGGSLFGTVYSNENAARWFPSSSFYNQEDWKFTLGYDDGQASPAWCGLFAEARRMTRGPDDQTYRKGSIVLVAEFCTARPDDRTKGDYSTTKDIAQGICRMCADWYDVRRFGYGDPMIFKADGHEQTLGHLFVDNGVTIEPASSRARVPGWSILKQYLANAQPVGRRHDGDPALYVNEAAAPHFVWELKNAMPSPKNPDDTDGSDHSLDGTRYYLVSKINTGGGVEVYDFWTGLRRI